MVCNLAACNKCVMFRMKKPMIRNDWSLKALALPLLVVVLGFQYGAYAVVTMKSGDGGDATSFNGNTNWSDNLAPSSGNFSVTNAVSANPPLKFFRLRVP